MIKSRLEQTTEYKENKDVLETDIGYSAPYFEVELFKKMYGSIALGNSIDNKKGILYFPVYYIESGIAVEQIGIYEIMKDDYKKKP